MSDVKQSWKRIAAWYRKNLPDGDFSLAPGASVEAIKAVETELEYRLPKDVKTSYRTHNGSGESAVFPYGFYLLSLEGVLKHWTMWRTHVDQDVFDGMAPNAEGPIKNLWWNTKWVPVTHNGGGDHQCIDMDPDLGGVAGQVIKFSHEVGAQKVLANSLEAWLSQFAASLENGQYRYDPDELWLVPVCAE